MPHNCNQTHMTEFKINSIKHAFDFIGNLVHACGYFLFSLNMMMGGDLQALDGSISKIMLSSVCECIISRTVRKQFFHHQRFISCNQRYGSTPN